MTHIETLSQAVNQFRDERDWRQFHKEKDLAISISLEANELLELFQWKDSETVLANKQESLRDELADVLIYALMLADNLDFDLEEIIMAKLEKNRQKYPIEKAKGSAKKYTELSE
ncbi:nucleotide pyrophosphohydrolase [Aerococcus kribbianus]|uniref:Nucleotide pyrophosphohydrolase n=1 Tax=Aerococcus kribbianus TaxID=2999064 RepID=A0A9X3FV68_9LACT|nr:MULTISPECIES: nucleotide pyrophosphohydrolase [unclassified Aerococcus]MCZ0716834.1 nucleotide pyrophosphohydrolase [Aerococcus sp. YH-aer221]MCZ0725122.1 nucleotide pyrophosphohydrolase [Aerococcus sp. YH-aer222]